MLLQILAAHPEAIATILRRTPIWVWALLAGLVALGATQLRDRTASLTRVSLLPISMTIFSVWGMLSAFRSSSLLATAMVLWLAAAGIAIALLAPGRTSARYDPARRSYALPGSVVPLLLIVAIFLVKYVVGVDLAMAPQLVQDSQYALTVSALYGAFSGIFIGRSVRLWRLALRPAATAVPA